VRRARAELDAFRWRELQRGRFHLRVTGRAGQRLTAAITTDDLFDANFASRPQAPERDFTMDLTRRRLALDTVLDRTGQLELVFWCRGQNLGFELALDSSNAPLDVGAGGAVRGTPFTVERGDIATRSGVELSWPRVGQAMLWLETGVSQALPVVLSPDEIDRLKELGYTR
jgi:hypothetical protein